MEIVNRAKNMIVSPRTEWDVVAAQPVELQALYRGYIGPLAAIPPVASLIGGVIFHHVSFGLAVLGAIVSYVLGLIAVYVVAWIAAKLAAMFGGRDEVDSGLKLVAFGSTASWVGGVFHVVPALGILSLLAAIYSIYLFYTGVTPTMGVPPGRVIGYLVVLIIAIIIVFIVVGLIVGGVVGAGVMAGGM